MNTIHIDDTKRSVSGRPAAQLKDVAAQLIAIGEQDQVDRKRVMSPGFDDDALYTADLKRQKQLERLMRGRGLFRLNEVGKDAVTAEFLIIQHSSPAFMKRFEQEMGELAARGDFPKDDYATFVDRLLVYEHKPQRYGTQANGDLELYPIEDEQFVDKRRASMGLPPLQVLLDKLEKVKQSVRNGKGLGLKR
ncbi:hypothetical protein B9J09_10355 [Xylella fastidiosa subsp. pauca]|uniref:DUF6624 domain-containing protein n=1 Tax=Xylella fastidiosa TaxID=2371 RepID=UPI0005833D30|nr:DUF6624 domain-containing protein [Xylella fastidiosa]ARO69755.1 hypothetical protein B9J09_10355 [Xylella fastidiosa subsp. pauca]AVI21815.1 hypothetical protein BCV75_09690 [Xylella fastidiosa]AVI23862.1 hypothetical protein BC375_09755 [Xylella fastidiosa]KIA58852.1 hypothetical protein RA12_03625 [Xylella fastidiosa]KXB10849.1 hypothetical protein ADT32_08745 [Xylella fastidiosa]